MLAESAIVFEVNPQPFRKTEHEMALGQELMNANQRLRLAKNWTADICANNSDLIVIAMIFATVLDPMCRRC
jgi:hypothetical protein